MAASPTRDFSQHRGILPGHPAAHASTASGSTASTKWKHVIEPEIVYSYVNGVNDFARFIRFDEDETLTDTNEIEYGFTSACTAARATRTPRN